MQLDASPDAKGVRLDVYVRDGERTVYNVEMQAVDTCELPQRSRCCHALMALGQLGRGRPYKELQNSYVIFVCGFDPFGLDRRVCYFESRCQGAEHLTLGDGTRTIFLSATAPRQGRGPGRLDEFLDYVADGRVSGEFSARLAAEVAGVLDNKKWRLEFMLLEVRDQLNYDRGLLAGREEGMEQGLVAGREEGKAQGIVQGELRFARLLKALLADGRDADIARVAADSDLRDELYRSYGIA